MPSFTLEGYERLQRSPKAREFVRALLPKLTETVERALLAYARGSEEKIRQANEAYAALRGPNGFPFSIEPFIKKAGSKTPQKIAIHILTTCNSNLSPNTIRNYSSPSISDVPSENSHEKTTAYHRPTRSAQFYLGVPKYRAGEVLRLWYTGITCQKIAVRLGLDQNLVGRMIHSLCPHTNLRRGRPPYRDYPKDLNISPESVVLLFEKYTASEIAEQLGTTQRIILKILHLKLPNGAMKKHGRRSRINYADYHGLDSEDIVRKIHQGASLQRVAESVGKSVETVRTIHHAVCKEACPQKRARKRVKNVEV